MNMKRNSTVDIAKGVGIVLVIIGHLNHFFSYEDMTLIMIYSFHMPLFIILSGYVFNFHSELSINEYCYKRFGQIIRPYFIFAIITLSYDIIRNGGAVRGDEIFGIFIGNGIDNHLSFNIALWFLPMLFLCNIIFGIIVKLSGYIVQMKMSYVFLIIVCVVMTIIGYYLIIHQKRFPWGVETAMFSQIFMLLGYIYKLQNDKHNTDIKNKKIFICVYPIIAFIWWFIAKFNGRVDMNAGRYGNCILFFVTAVCGFCLIWQISNFISKIPVFKTIFSVLGKNSLYILAYHIPATYIVYNAILPYMPSFIKNNAWKPNVIGILYICIGDILISLLMKLVHTSSQNVYVNKK